MARSHTTMLFQRLPGAITFYAQDNKLLEDNEPQSQREGLKLLGYVIVKCGIF